MEQIPTAAQVVARLKPMQYQQLDALSRLSGVPFHTLLKIRDAETLNPRIDTVSRFWPHVDTVLQAA